MKDLQECELCGSTQKTLWQLCQLVARDIPGELRDQNNMYTAPCLHKGQIGS